MKKAAKVYVYAIIALGAVLLPYCIWQAAGTFKTGDPANTVSELMCLLVICSVCRSAPLYINGHFAIDVSILATITAVLLKGPYVASVLYVLSSFLTFDTDSDEKWHYYLKNTTFTKAAFNISNLFLSILFPGLLTVWMGHIAGNTSMPQVLLPMFVFTVLSFLMNNALLLVLFLLNGEMDRHNALSTIGGLVPNVLAAMPLGLLTCLIFAMPSGCWISLCMLLPLMLARHAWKLYIDSQTQYYRLINAFVATVEARDKYTEGHSRRVNQYAGMIAKEMRLRAHEAEIIKVAALLHDIGKIGIADAILMKPGRLSQEEYARIQEHPYIGVHIVEKVGLDRKIIEIIRHHHERYDGQGYPEHVSGDDLSLGAQILGVADAFDAMTSDRPYRKGLPFDEAVNRLRQERGAQFSPDVVDAFLRVASRGDVQKEMSA